jgi:hypothetical protein
MAKQRESSVNLADIEELARGWGKLLAQQAFPNGVGLDVDLSTMEQVAATATKALVRGTLESLTATQAHRLGTVQACPGCGREVTLEQRSRTVHVRGGTADVTEPVGHCSTCRRDFFPSAAGAEAGCSPL